MLEIMTPAAVRLRLAEILEKKNMTQKDLAEATGVSKNAISKLTGTPRQIRMATIEQLCKVLNVEPGDLFEYDRDKSVSQ